MKKKGRKRKQTLKIQVFLSICLLSLCHTLFLEPHWAFPENNRAGGVEDLFFQKFMLTPCDIPLVTPCDSRFRYPTLVTTTIYPCDRPKYQHFTLVTKLITTFIFVIKYRSSSFFPLVTCKWVFLPL